MIIVLDFDGTVVTHEFPKIGRDIGAVPVLKELVDNGHKLILFTMRSNVINPKSEDTGIVLKGGNYLDDAVQWFKDRDIPLWGIQTNPEQASWTFSPKAYGHLYIDDAELGMPLVHLPISKAYERPFVDWDKVREMLIQQKIIKEI